MQNVAKTYFQTQFATMGQGEVLLLLYDGALKFLAQAREKILAKDYAAKGIAISKALDIVAELDSTLNTEAGGELAANLHQLYFLCSTRLLTVNLKMDVALLDSVVSVLTGLRGAYAEIQNRPDAQAASRQIAGKQQAFSIKGRADTPVEAGFAPAPGAGGATRAQAAYAARLHQTAPVPAQDGEADNAAPPAAPALTPGETSMPPLSPPSFTASRAASLSAYGRAAQYPRP